MSQVTPSVPAKNPPLEHDSSHQLHLGFDRVRAVIEALPTSDLEAVNLPVGSVVQTVLGTYPEIVLLRDELRKFGALDMQSVDNLRDYALALGYAHTLYRIAKGTPDTQLVKDLFNIRERFHADAAPLVLRGLLDAAQVTVLKSGNNHQGLAYDVIGLCELFLANWDKFAGKLLLEKAEIDSARLAANRLLSALGAKEQGPSVNAEVSVLRQKAFTLLLRTYNDVRAAVAFIRRREADVDSIVPSLYANRGRRYNNSGSEDSETENLQDEIAASASLNAAVASAFAPAQAAGGPQVPVGFPGAPLLSDS